MLKSPWQAIYDSDKQRKREPHWGLDFAVTSNVKSVKLFLYHDVCAETILRPVCQTQRYQVINYFWRQASRPSGERKCNCKTICGMQAKKCYRVNIFCFVLFWCFVFSGVFVFPPFLQSATHYVWLPAHSFSMWLYFRYFPAHLKVIFHWFMTWMTKTSGAFVYYPLDIINWSILFFKVDYLGLMENLRVRRAGFAFRMHYKRFLQRLG